MSSINEHTLARALMAAMKWMYLDTAQYVRCEPGRMSETRLDENYTADLSAMRAGYKVATATLAEMEKTKP